MSSVSASSRVLPGFRLTLGATLLYLGVLVFVPLLACFARATDLTPEEFRGAVWSERARAAYVLTLGTSFVAALLNVVLGFLVAWVLVRYQFPMKRLFDALVDLPFALPTAVAGLVFSSLYVETGWLGQFLVPLGIEGAYSRLGIVLVLTFIGLPFVARTVQPVLEEFDIDFEDAAAILGANRWQTFTRVVLPSALPALFTGFTLAFARGLGEYGSVIFISGNIPYETEIAAVLIVARLEEYSYAEATAIAVVLLTGSLALLALINFLQRRIAHDAR